ncbi:MAG TPA: T9SS type A sorting domain-containing protein [bacterium]
MCYMIRSLFIPILIILNSCANAQSWEPAVILPKHGSGFIMNTDLVCLNDSCLIAAWDQDTSNNMYTDNIFVSIKNNNTWTNPVTLSESNVECSAPRICVDQNGIVHIIWGVNSIGFIGRVDKLAYSFWNGSSWSSFEYIASNATISEGSYYISCDTIGNLHIMYGNETAPDPTKRIRHIWRIGNTWYGPEVVDGSPDFHFIIDSLSITRLTYQNALLPNHNNDVYYNHLDSTCGSWFGPYVVHYSDNLDTLSYWPRIVVDHQLRKHVCWSEDLNNDILAEQILYSFSDDDSNWSNSEDVTGNLNLALMIICSAMIVDSFNNIHIAYGYYADSNLTQGCIGYQCRQNSTWSTPYIISQSVTCLGTARLALDNNILHIIWVADTLGDKYVCYRRKQLTAVEEQKNIPMFLNIVPNPVKNTVKLLFAVSTTGFARIQLFDVMGRKIMAKSLLLNNAGIHSVMLDLSNIAAGTYFLVVKTDNNSFSKPLIKLND